MAHCNMAGRSFPPPIRKFNIAAAWLLFCLLAVVLSGCSPLLPPPGPTPLPSEFIPTVIALTLQAGRTEPPPAAAAGSNTPTPAIDTPIPATATAAGPTPAPPEPTLTATPGGTVTPTRKPSPTPSPTRTPEIPYAEIEFRNLGPLSRVVSPISVQTYFKSGGSGKLRIELLGEDGRMLYRNIRPITSVAPGAWVFLVLDVDFEISAVAESGRLQLSVDDEYGRVIALNTVPLILLSIGEADINPPVDAQAPLIIQQPGRKALVQGGKVLVTGLVRPESDQPLMVRLLTTKGSEVGARLASITPADGGYSTFAVEVPYNITNPTSVLLVVTMGAANINDVIHLSSREIMIGP